MKAKLISITKGAEGNLCESAQDLISYSARVSNPANQNNKKTAPKLIKYLIESKHWSPFEMASMCLEITTSRGVAAQILRHKSFSMQEYSQRYSLVTESSICIYEARRQDTKNRQNSIDDIPEAIKEEWRKRQQRNWERAYEDYQWALERNIAKECARTILPLGTKTTLHMSGTIRSWIHYIDLRADVATQLEHRQIAQACKEIFIQELPDVAAALGWQKIQFDETQEKSS